MLVFVQKRKEKDLHDYVAGSNTLLSNLVLDTMEKASQGKPAQRSLKTKRHMCNVHVTVNWPFKVHLLKPTLNSLTYGH